MSTQTDSKNALRAQATADANFTDFREADIAVLADQIIRYLGLETALAQTVVGVMIQNLRVMDRKQKDYGSANLVKFGAQGVLVRASDKMERLINLMEQARTQSGPAAVYPLNEPINDSWLDLANYALIGYVMSAGNWPKK